MIKAYLSQRAAIAAAKKALGAQAKKWVDFNLTPVSLTEDPDDRWNVGWTWQPIRK